MDEAEVRERFAKLRGDLAEGREPDEVNILALAEGFLVNLARLVGTH